MLYILTCTIRFPLYMLFNQEIRNAFCNEIVRTSICMKFYELPLIKKGNDTRKPTMNTCLYTCCFCCYNEKPYRINKKRSSIQTQNRKTQYSSFKKRISLRFYHI